MKLDQLIAQNLVGKKITHVNAHGRTVTLEIESYKTENHSEDLEPSTRANDWWPATRDWTTNTITFVDGSKIQVDDGYDFKFTD